MILFTAKSLMAALRRILLFCLLWCVALLPAPAAEPDWGEVKPLPIPLELQGLWAQGRHCNDTKRQLRVTKLTMQFGNHKPVRSYYFPSSGGVSDYDGGIVPDVDDPSLAFSGPALTYDRDLGFLFDYGNDKSPEQLYYRCPDRKPRNR